MVGAEGVLALFAQLDQVVTVGAQDRLAGFARLECKGRLFEFGNHGPGGETAEVAAVGGTAGIYRVRAGDLGEVAAGGQ